MLIIRQKRWQGITAPATVCACLPVGEHKRNTAVAMGRQDTIPVF